MLYLVGSNIVCLAIKSNLVLWGNGHFDFVELGEFNVMARWVFLFWFSYESSALFKEDAKEESSCYVT